ncbi:MAG: aminotransferase class I/II-fold pyridoxal phosphate-dependent enzyme [Planctomycetota bacterium]|nr:aminotransferase class I/II-fold pyridoxal phosphate-dependent enzyme [Planctomycetota bacterium]
MVFCDPENRIPAIREAVGKIARMRLCINSPVQYAVKPALEGPQNHIDNALERLRKRADICMDKFRAIQGISCTAPRGAFYAFPSIDIEGVDDHEFVLGLLRQEGVLWVHGGGFGQRPGTAHRPYCHPPP